MAPAARLKPRLMAKAEPKQTRIEAHIALVMRMPPWRLLLRCLLRPLRPLHVETCELKPHSKFRNVLSDSRGPPRASCWISMAPTHVHGDPIAASWCHVKHAVNNSAGSAHGNIGSTVHRTARSYKSELLDMVPLPTQIPMINYAGVSHAGLAPCGVHIPGAIIAECAARPASNVDWISTQ